MLRSDKTWEAYMLKCLASELVRDTRVVLIGFWSGTANKSIFRATGFICPPASKWGDRGSFCQWQSAMFERTCYEMEQVKWMVWTAQCDGDAVQLLPGEKKTV